MNKNKLTWGITVVKSNSFVRFWEESMSWKKSLRLCLTFTIYPLGTKNCYTETGAPVWQLQRFTNKHGVSRPLRVLSGIVSRYLPLTIVDNTQKLYCPSTQNISLIIWHIQCIVTAVNFQIMDYFFHFLSFLGKNVLSQLQD